MLAMISMISCGLFATQGVAQRLGFRGSGGRAFREATIHIDIDANRLIEQRARTSLNVLSITLSIIQLREDWLREPMTADGTTTRENRPRATGTEIFRYVTI